MSSPVQSSGWFAQARFGLFIHWGPYSSLGRGEQVLFREHLDHREYADMACRWDPKNFDARNLAAFAQESGVKYCVFTTRHHDGYCLWDSNSTDYTSAQQAPKRDFVREYVDACREAGLKVGLYYSLADWRIPAYWLGEQKDPEGWRSFREYVHAQVEELMTNYGKIDVIWFDGPWPHSSDDWESEELIRKIRVFQPNILINNRLDAETQVGQSEQAGGSRVLGDFGTPEHQIVASDRLWESCQVTTWRLWGYAHGEHYRSAEEMLDMLCDCSAQGGNLLLNIGLDGEGGIPLEVVSPLRRVGRWLKVNGEAIYGTQRGDVTEFVTSGYQTRRGNALYLIYRFWPKKTTTRLAGLDVGDAKATLLADGQALNVAVVSDGLDIGGLPAEPPCDLFPVVRLEVMGPIKVFPWARERLWAGDASRMASWAAARGGSVWADGAPRDLVVSTAS